VALFGCQVITLRRFLVVHKQECVYKLTHNKRDILICDYSMMYLLPSGRR